VLHRLQIAIRKLPVVLALFVVLVCTVTLLAASSLAAFPAQKGQRPASHGPFATVVPPFLKTHCVRCHNSTTANAGLNLEELQTQASLETSAETWSLIARKVRIGEMPPPDAPRPDASKARAFAGWVSDELVLQAKRARPTAGHVAARRLNRLEYNNTIRDLLGVDMRPADDFPQDDSGYGFDNIADVLSLSPPLMERYLSAAEKVARAAVFGPEVLKPRLVELRSPRRDPAPLDVIPAEYDRTGLTMPNTAHVTYRFPADGEYLFRGVFTGLRPVSADPMNLVLWIDGKRVQEMVYTAHGTPSFPGGPLELYGQKAEFGRRFVTAGDHWIAISVARLYEGLPPSFHGPNPSKQPEPEPRPFRLPPPPKDATPEQLAEYEARQKRIAENQARLRKGLANSARMTAIEVGGPYDQQRAPAAMRSRARLYACGHLDGRHQADCTRVILGNLARRAFRRPVNRQELAPYLRLVSDSRKRGESFEEALCVGVQAVLVSPRFLFRIEQDAPSTARGTQHRITDHELASRLSYFLWSSMPDRELTQCADNATLSRKDVLERQVERMLRDPKASALVESFAGQWLELRKLESVKPDLDKFPIYDEYLRTSMRRETEMLFKEIVQKDRSILELLDTDYTFLNERLAQFYGIRGVEGPEFRRVSLANTNRGGILTQASVLTVTSYPTRTSPVLRGKWILENLLNSPPPPPPPGVPALEETKVPAGASLRTQLEAHRKNPLCASCHTKMDSLGFGLENFDAVGSWRTVDGSALIEASGNLPSGKTFTGPKQLKAILLEDKETFTRCMTTKLLTYALGRGVERYDQPVVNQIAKDVSKGGYRFSKLVSGIVTSLPFQQRKDLLP
jgi:cytochrome c553